MARAEMTAWDLLGWAVGILILICWGLYELLKAISESW